MKDINVLINNGIDVKESLNLFGDIKTYNETLKTFLEEVDEKLDKISKYKEIADMANYAILVHSLKSDAKYFGFKKLAELSYNHEMASKANNYYKVSEEFDSLMKEAKRIVAVVRDYLGEEPIKEFESVNIKKDKTLLIVDDSEVISSFVRKIFNNEFNVVVARDGMEAFNIIRTMPINGMLLDLNMPNVNGFVVLETFKKNNLFTRIPVSIITGVGDDNLVDKVNNYPIIAVLRKPFNEKSIKEVVEKTII